MDDGTKKEVFGEPIKIGQWDCFLVHDSLGFKFTINEYYSGMKITEGIYMNGPSFDQAKELMYLYSRQTIINHCKGQLQFHGLDFPLNS